MKPVNYLEMAQTKSQDSEPDPNQAPDDQDSEDTSEDMPGQIALLSSIMKRMAHKHAKHMEKSKSAASEPDMHPSIHILMAAKAKPKR